MSAVVHLRRGSLYVDASTFERYLADREAVTLVRRDDDLYIVPLEDSALGGFLCKRRTAAGDRVVHAAEFFRDNGVDDSREAQLVGTWRSDVAAIVLPGVFRPAA